MSDHVCIQAETIGILKEKADNFERWQQTQNGTLTRIEKKIDNFNAWLYGVMGSLVLALILLIINLIAQRG